MKKEEIISKKNNISAAIKAGRLHDAFRDLKSLSEARMTWEITDEINRLEESYRLMLDYAMRGVADPSRSLVYDGIVDSMLSLLDRLVVHVLVQETPSLYYNYSRYKAQSGAKSVATLIRRYRQLCEKSSLINLVMSEKSSTDMAAQRREMEALECELFNYVWASFPLTAADKEALHDFFASAAVPGYVKQLLVSALFMGLMEFYDSRRLMLLMDIYGTGDATLSSTALIGVLLTLYRYRERPLDKSVRDRVKLMTDVPSWHNDLKDAFLELVRARDTERITRKMQDEVVPEIMKLRPELSKRFDPNSDASLEDALMGENPEWQEMLEKSGIADKMKELFEIQLEGGDVFMSTFAHLKSFPFFNEIAHWFLPYHAEQSNIANTPEELRPVTRLIENVPVFCNGDKYSFILSLQSIPASQREIVKQQFSSQIDALAEIEHASLSNKTTERRNIMNRYVQDLYRFFRLYRRRDEFKDPFVEDLNLVTIPVLKGEFRDSDSLKAIAEFYFKHRYYRDSLDLFTVIEDLTFPDAQLYEKMGFCFERIGDINRALQYYEQAELLNAESVWTLSHIALCCRLLGQSGRALEYYKRVAALEKEDNEATVMAIGNCYLDMGQFEQASKQFFKARYLDEKSKASLRPLAWSLLMLKDFDRARTLYREILADNPAGDDYLNMGHLSLASGDNDNALNYYKLSIASGNGNLATFTEKINSDAPCIERIGISRSVIPLIIDAIAYASQS